MKNFSKTYYNNRNTKNKEHKSHNDVNAFHNKPGKSRKQIAELRRQLTDNSDLHHKDNISSAPILSLNEEKNKLANHSNKNKHLVRNKKNYSDNNRTNQESNNDKYNPAKHKESKNYGNNYQKKKSQGKEPYEIEKHSDKQNREIKPDNREYYKREKEYKSFKDNKNTYKDNKNTHKDNKNISSKKTYNQVKPVSKSFKKNKSCNKYSIQSRSNNSDKIRLNKFIANAGVCSRREADELIHSGAIKVNGVIVTELGIKISTDDIVQYGDQTLNSEKKRYVLLNKPKGYITTVEDPQGRNTVMTLIKNACYERIYPVGRLDRNTTGLLLFTNDGELAKKLMHPKHNIKKIYHVELNKVIKRGDMLKVMEGIEIDGEVIKVDAVEYIENERDRKKIGIELHSGQNRIVRRIFESLNYMVVKLDRVGYAGLTKKNLPRGHWRFLTNEEINILKRLH